MAFYKECSWSSKEHRQLPHRNEPQTFYRMVCRRDVKIRGLYHMENVSYQSKFKEKIPTTKTKKADIVEWLTSKDLPHNSGMLNIVRWYRDQYRL